MSNQFSLASGTPLADAPITNNTNPVKTTKKAPAGVPQTIPANKKLKVHPLAQRFPMLDGETLNGMKLSIQLSGQQYPAILDQDGVLLDGRMRKLCCEELGVPLKTETRHFESELAREQFILASNKDRRLFGLDQSAALIVDRYFDEYETAAKKAQTAGASKGGSAKGKAGEASPQASPPQGNRVRERLQAEWSVSEYRAKIACKLYKEANDLLKDVIVGKLTLNAALKALQKRNAMPKKKTVVGKPGGNPNAIQSMLGPDAIAEIEAKCEELAEWLDGQHDEPDSLNEADDVVEAYFRQRKTDRQDAQAGGQNGEAEE